MLIFEPQDRELQQYIMIDVLNVHPLLGRRPGAPEKGAEASMLGFYDQAEGEVEAPDLGGK